MPSPLANVGKVAPLGLPDAAVPGRSFQEALAHLEATHKWEVDELQGRVSRLSAEVSRLQVSLREAVAHRRDGVLRTAQRKRGATASSLCSSIDEPHLQAVTREVAEELALLAASGNVGEVPPARGSTKRSHLLALPAPPEGSNTDDAWAVEAVGPQVASCKAATAHSQLLALTAPPDIDGYSEEDWGSEVDCGSVASRASCDWTDAAARLSIKRSDGSSASLQRVRFREAKGFSCCSAFGLGFDDWISDLNLHPVVQRWWFLVDRTLAIASSKKFYELREPWVQPQAFMDKVTKKHNKDSLDFHILDDGGVKKTLSGNKKSSSSIYDNEDAYLDIDQAFFGNFLNCKGNTPPWECLILDPQSPKRVAWMGIGMLLMVYDIIVLPMMAFPLEENGVLEAVKWISQIFWTLDILVTFFTGVYIDSELCLKLRKIAWAYARTWLIMDILVVVPLWVIEIVDLIDTEEEEAGGSALRAGDATRLFKYVRLLRFLRLVRIAKFEHYLQEALAAVNSSALILSVGILKNMTMMVILNHINACCWYAIGRHSDDGWVEAYDGTPMFYRYLTSMHWAITQFQGTSEIFPGMGGGKGTLERLYAVTTVIFALIILAAFVSKLTNSMMQLQSLREERTGLERSVRAYLSVNSISLGLSVRVKRYIDWKQAMNQSASVGEAVLQLLPKGLQMEVLTEVRGPKILAHDFFNVVHQVYLRQFRLVCHEALENLQPAPDEWIFMPQDACHHMYFIVSGECRYISVGRLAGRSGSVARHSFFLNVMEETLARHKNKHQRRLQLDTRSAQMPDIVSLTAGHWVSEAVLWTPWEHPGALLSVRDSMMLTLSATEFSRIMTTFPPAHASAVLYARQFVAALNRFGKTYTDVIDLESLRANSSD